MPCLSSNAETVHLSCCWCLQIEAINEAFVEARDEIEYAKEVHTDVYHILFVVSMVCGLSADIICAQDSETVYFNEAHETAKAAVSTTLSKFEALLAVLAKPEADKLQRSMGMKMQQLKVGPLARCTCIACANHSSSVFLSHCFEKRAHGWESMQAELLELDELHA